MDLSDQATVHFTHSVINNTINKFSSSSGPASSTKLRSPEDAEARAALARRAVKSASFKAAERGDPPKCHPDTRVAAQDSLEAWRNNPKAGPVRLISGWAGTGKTTIAQTMAEYWAKRNQLGGSFFFSRSSDERCETDLVPETLLHQFLQIFGANVDVGFLNNARIRWSELVDVLVSTSPSLPQPVVIVIDGLDECRDTDHQVSLLRDILNSLGQLGSSVKVLISCRPERHLEDVFNQFSPQLGPSYRIHLGQSAEDNDDIRTFFQLSFDRICQHRRQDGAMSITDGPWPSQNRIEELVDRAGGQFIFAATAIRLVDDENEDPVEMLNLVLRPSSFQAIDQLYVVILNRVGLTLDKSDKSLERRQLMQNLLLHVYREPSSSLSIAEFWFEKEVKINILVKHLQAVLVRNPSRDSEIVIQFRHKSFHDFFARPSAPHSFSLSETNPVPKFFFDLRKMVREITTHGHGIQLLRPSQHLCCTFLRFKDHPPTVFPYQEEARRLHQAYIRDRPTFRGCRCLPLQARKPTLTLPTFLALRSCGQADCIMKSGVFTLGIMFLILKLFLWFRVMLYGLLSDPSTALYGTTRALMHRPSSLKRRARCIAVVNGLLCVAVLVNARWDVVLLLHVSYIVTTFLLRLLLAMLQI